MKVDTYVKINLLLDGDCDMEETVVNAGENTHLHLSLTESIASDLYSLLHEHFKNIS